MFQFHVYVVCNDNAEKAILSEALQQALIVVSSVNDIMGLLEVWFEKPAHMAILCLRDLTTEHIRHLRENIVVPLIALSDVIREDEHIAMLESGIDLVMFRPYSTRLLVSQIPALLRRTVGVTPTAVPNINTPSLQLNSDNYTVHVQGKGKIRLTQLEFTFLYVLMTHHKQTLPLNTLVEKIWGYTGEGSEKLVRQLAHRVRKKVESDAKNPQHIITVPSVGYMFEP